MGTISATWAQGGFPDASKTYTLSDADMVKGIAAFQQAANTAVNGTATRAQVLNFMFDTMIKQELQNQIQTHETVPASTPPPITIT